MGILLALETYYTRISVFNENSCNTQQLKNHYETPHCNIPKKHRKVHSGTGLP